MGTVRQSLWLLLVLVLVASASQVDNGGGGHHTESTEGAAPPWKCPRPGRFPNPADPSCRTYLTCAVVTAGNGTNGTRLLAPARQDECWPGALFSGRYQRCITGDDCAALEDFYAIEYECSECGKYVLESSTDCRHFVNCLKTRDPGVFVPIRQRCPDERPLFSPPAHACVPEDEYECGAPPPPLPSLLSMLPPPLSAAAAAPPPPPPRPPMTPVMTTTTTTTTQATTTTTTSTMVTLPSTDGHHLSDLVCLGVGRFPDESVPHCRGYRLCIAANDDDDDDDDGEGDDGTRAGAARPLVSRRFLCDPGTVFSEYVRRCVPAASYQCPDDGTTTGAITTDAAAAAVTSTSAFRCVTVGRFPDREPGGRCRRFYRCRRASDGSLESPVLERCPPGTIFSWLTTRCVPPAEYVCPVVVVVAGEPPEPLDPQEPPESTSGSSSNRCVRSGRFANDADATCRTYYICTRDQRGAWALVLIRCPAGTIFSRTVAQCVGSEAASPLVGGHSCRQPVQCGANGDDDGDEAGSADCPMRSSASAETAGPVIAGSGDDGAPWLTWSATEPLTADASTSEVDVDVDGGDLVLSTSDLRPTTTPEYPCTATGRFADINSVDCRSYFLCKLLQQPPTNHPLPQPADGGGFQQQQQQQQQRHHHHHQLHNKQQQQQQQQILVSVHMTCPDGMLFSRNTNKCVISNRHVC